MYFIVCKYLVCLCAQQTPERRYRAPHTRAHLSLSPLGASARICASSGLVRERRAANPRAPRSRASVEEPSDSDVARLPWSSVHEHFVVIDDCGKSGDGVERWPMPSAIIDEGSEVHRDPHDLADRAVLWVYRNTR